MTELNRRNFIKLVTIAGASTALVGVTGILSSCGSNDKDDKETKANIAALRVSSDIYLADVMQRLSFSIFDDQSKVISKGNLRVVITSPTGKKQTFAKVPVREKGIKGKGIYSILIKLDEIGSWSLETTFEGEPLDLAFTVNASNTAPALTSKCPETPTPTESNPLDATILCTRFEGQCELHKQSIPELLETRKPFVVLFATPARCQTSYCGPVLELTRKVAKSNSIPVVHIEIYKNETSTETLDAVNSWGLESEPWMFGVKADGTINSRLDGAFDQSEIEDLFSSLT